MNEMKVTCIYYPGETERKLMKRCVWVTAGSTKAPKDPPSPELVSSLLNARHSPIRVLNFAFLFENIPSNTATHLCRHRLAQPFVSSLRNDRQSAIDGDTAPRNTPVNMILYVNGEELMVIANKRLCNKAAPMTRRAVQMMCMEALKVMPEFEGLLVPMCQYGRCHEIQPCGKEAT